MNSGTFAGKLSELDFEVKKINFPCDIRKETDDIYSIVSFVNDFDPEKIKSMNVQELQGENYKIIDLKKTISRLHPQNLKEIEDETFRKLDAYHEMVSGCISEISNKAQKKEQIRCDLKYYITFGIGCLLAVLYTVFLFVGAYDFTYAIPLICTVISASDKEKFKKLSLIPYVVMCLGTLINFFVDIFGASGETIFFNALELVFVGIVTGFYIARPIVENNTFKENLLCCIPATVWSIFMSLLLNNAPALIYDGYWNMAWFIPLVFAIFNAIAIVIRKFLIYDAPRIQIAFNIIGLSYILIRVLFSGTLGLDIILFIALVVAEIIVGGKILKKFID